MADFGSGLSGAAAGASAGSTFGPIGTIAGGILGGIGGLFGGGKKKSAGSTSVAQVAPNYIGSLQNVNAETTAGYDNLAKFVTPGSGRLSNALTDVYNAQRNRLTNSRSAAISNLRESLSRRRLGGSSFASDALSRADAEYRMQENELAAAEAQDQAKTALAEFEMQTKLFQARQDARNQYILDAVKMFSADADRAAGVMNGNNTLSAELLKQSAEARGGNFAGALDSLKSLSASIGNIFSTPSGTPGGKMPDGNQTYWGTPTPIKT